MKIFGRSMLPGVPSQGTKIVPLRNADEIFRAEQDVLGSTGFGESFYISHYSLPLVRESPSTGSAASNAQRQILPLMEEKIRKEAAQAYIVVDNSLENSKEGGQIARNEGTLQWLHDAGAFILSYPAQYVSISHPKFIANENHAVVTSANLSGHSADAPDDNTGFLISGAGAHNGIVRAFLPQWWFSAEQDRRGWAQNYPAPKMDLHPCFDEKVFWLNTAPAEENGGCDSTQIFDAYRGMIGRAASGPPNACLYFEHFDLSDLMLLRHLLYARRVNPTLDIRFILDPNQYMEGLKAAGFDCRTAAYNEVRNAGIPVRFAKVCPHPNGSSEPQRLHDKFAVYNDAEVINGSGNLSNSSLNGNGMIPLADEKPVKKHLHNREVDVLVRDPSCAQAFKNKFLEDWAARSLEDPAAAAGQGADTPA